MAEKLQQIKATFDFGYCPIVFACDKSSKNYTYLLNLWRIAIDKTMIEYPEFTGHTWRIFNQNERKLVFSSDNYADANLFFWQKLEELWKDRFEIKSSCCATTSTIIAQSFARKLSIDFLQSIRTIKKAMLLINL